MKSVRHYNLIPYSHRCVTCGLNKTNVNFYVQVNHNTTYVLPQCNVCKAHGVKTKYGSKGLLIASIVYPVRYDIKHRIDMYFKGYIDEH